MISKLSLVSLIFAAFALAGVVFVLNSAPEQGSVVDLTKGASESQPDNNSSPVVLASPSPASASPEQRLSYDQVFNENHEWVNDLPAGKVRTLVVTGDVLTARSVNFKTVKNNDFTRLFTKTADVLKSADLTLVNLETPLIPNCPLTNEGMSFCGDPRNAEGLAYAGVDVASLANNHTGNHGKDGVATTVKILNEAGIASIGTIEGGPVYKEVDGLTFAFLGYNDVDKQPGVATADHERILSEAKEAQSRADVVVAMFHWGAEYRSQPTTRQQELAHLAIDSGVDVVVSNHPHWIQPIESYMGKIIAYALGNFIFDQTWSQKTQEGVVARFVFYEDRLVDLEFLPVRISSSGQPEFMAGTEKTRILTEMKEESLKLSAP